MKISELVQELQSIIQVDKDILTKTEQSKVTTKNSFALREVLQLWEDGTYSDCPEMMLRELEIILNRETSKS